MAAVVNGLSTVLERGQSRAIGFDLNARRRAQDDHVEWKWRRRLVVESGRSGVPEKLILRAAYNWP